MRLFARFFRLIWGGDVDRPLRPVLAVSFVGSSCFSAGWSFVGIWAIRELGATKSQLGVTFLIAALVGMVAGYLGGHASDYVGRRPMILLGWALLGFAFLLFAFVGDRTYVGLALLVFSAIGGSVGGGADQAMVADLVPPERHEAAYASVRVASNLGVVCGPPIGGLLLVGGHWPILFGGVASMCVGAIAIAWRYLPRRGAYAPEEPPTRGSLAVIARDHAFLVFLVSGALAYLVYVAIETVLPISAVDTHGVAPWTWGLIVVLNPLMVTLFQLRLTRATTWFAPGPKLATAMLMMGGSFLLLLGSNSVGDLRRRRARVRLRGDAVGADLPGDRRRARAGGRSRGVHGSVRLYGGDRVRPGAIHRPSLAGRVRGGRSVAVLRGGLARRGRHGCNRRSRSPGPTG